MTTDTAAPPRLYSEQRAAAALGIPKTRLHGFRKQGRLTDGLVLSEPAADRYGYAPKNAAIQYDAERVDQVARGEQPLLVPEPTPASA